MEFSPETGFFLKYAFFFSLEIVGFGWIWLNPTRYSRISLDLVEISPDLACFCRIWPDFFVAPVGSGCSGFGDANLPLDPLVSVFENGNPPPTDWTFGLGWNRVVVGRFGRVVGLQSSLDSPNLYYVFNFEVIHLIILFLAIFNYFF